jgi:hypothetical protein
MTFIIHIFDTANAKKDIHTIKAVEPPNRIDHCIFSVLIKNEDSNETKDTITIANRNPRIFSKPPIERANIDETTTPENPEISSFLNFIHHP